MSNNEMSGFRQEMGAAVKKLRAKYGYVPRGLAIHVKAAIRSARANDRGSFNYHVKLVKRAANVWLDRSPQPPPNTSA